jgi:WD repeat-containing protein 7
MVAYCPTTRRIAFGGKNGTIVIHELKASKAQSISAHKTPITALAFSQDGKYLASYSANDAKMSFWQSQQTFLVIKKFYFQKNYYNFERIIVK